jgi:hypothetical protein
MSGGPAWLRGPCLWLRQRSTLDSMQAALEVGHLRKSYSGTVAVRDLSFRVERGEILGTVGPEGAGKTTTGLDPQARRDTWALVEGVRQTWLPEEFPESGFALGHGQIERCDQAAGVVADEVAEPLGPVGGCLEDGCGYVCCGNGFRRRP